MRRFILLLFFEVFLQEATPTLMRKFSNIKRKDDDYGRNFVHESTMKTWENQDIHDYLIIFLNSLKEQARQDTEVNLHLGLNTDSIYKGTLLKKLRSNKVPGKKEIEKIKTLEKSIVSHFTETRDKTKKHLRKTLFKKYVDFSTKYPCSEIYKYNVPKIKEPKLKQQNLKKYISNYKKDSLFKGTDRKDPIEELINVLRTYEAYLLDPKMKVQSSPVLKQTKHYNSVTSNMNSTLLKRRGKNPIEEQINVLRPDKIHQLDPKVNMQLSPIPKKTKLYKSVTKYIRTIPKSRRKKRIEVTNLCPDEVGQLDPKLKAKLSPMSKKTRLYKSVSNYMRTLPKRRRKKLAEQTNVLKADKIDQLEPKITVKLSHFPKLTKLYKSVSRCMKRSFAESSQEKKSIEQQTTVLRTQKTDSLDPKLKEQFPPVLKQSTLYESISKSMKGVPSKRRQKIEPSEKRTKLFKVKKKQVLDTAVKRDRHLKGQLQFKKSNYHLHHQYQRRNENSKDLESNFPGKSVLGIYGSKPTDRSQFATKISKCAHSAYMFDNAYLSHMLGMQLKDSILREGNLDKNKVLNAKSFENSNTINTKYLRLSNQGTKVKVTTGIMNVTKSTGTNTKYPKRLIINQGSIVKVGETKVEIIETNNPKRLLTSQENVPEMEIGTNAAKLSETNTEDKIYFSNQGTRVNVPLLKEVGKQKVKLNVNNTKQKRTVPSPVKLQEMKNRTANKVKLTGKRQFASPGTKFLECGASNAVKLTGTNTTPSRLFASRVIVSEKEIRTENEVQLTAANTEHEKRFLTSDETRLKTPEVKVEAAEHFVKLVRTNTKCPKTSFLSQGTEVRASNKEISTETNKPTELFISQIIIPETKITTANVIKITQKNTKRKNKSLTIREKDVKVPIVKEVKSGGSGDKRNTVISVDINIQPSKHSFISPETTHIANTIKPTEDIRNSNQCYISETEVSRVVTSNILTPTLNTRHPKKLYTTKATKIPKIGTNEIKSIEMNSNYQNIPLTSQGRKVNVSRIRTENIVKSTMANSDHPKMFLTSQGRANLSEVEDMYILKPTVTNTNYQTYQFTDQETMLKDLESKIGTSLNETCSYKEILPNLIKVLENAEENLGSFGELPNAIHAEAEYYNHVVFLLVSVLALFVMMYGLLLWGIWYILSNLR